jgi:hypothetical protein
MYGPGGTQPDLADGLGPIWTDVDPPSALFRTRFAHAVAGVR